MKAPAVPDDDSTLRSYLETCDVPTDRELRAFVLANGERYTRQPYPENGPRLRPLGECFQQSIVLSIDVEQLAYVEGFALARDGRPYHHAWCADEHARVVDCTWGAHGLAYFGVRLPPDFVNRRWQELRGTNSAKDYNLLPSFIAEQGA